MYSRQGETNAFTKQIEIVSYGKCWTHRVLALSHFQGAQHKIYPRTQIQMAQMPAKPPCLRILDICP